MAEDPLKTLSDMATEAHAQVQQDYRHINPVIGVRRGMRGTGIPADALTIDCLQSRQRIVLILHDEHPGQLIYQFTVIDDGGDEMFRQIPLAEVGARTLRDWMVQHLRADG